MRGNASTETAIKHMLLSQRDTKIVIQGAFCDVLDLTSVGATDIRLVCVVANKVVIGAH